MNTKQRYLTILSSDEFLPGTLVLYHSLRTSGAQVPLEVMVTDRVSPQALAYLDALEIPFRLLPHLKNPHRHYRFKSFRNNFNMLHVFNQQDLDKVVFLDSDMLVCKNPDELFGKAHGSAVNSGGMLPECASWMSFNGGLMVIEPSRALFEDMRAKSRKMPSSNGGGQGCLHAYFSDWSEREELRLDHGYNLYPGHWNRYHELYGYEVADEEHYPKNEVKILHFWGPCKPWVMEGFEDMEDKYGKAFRLWKNTFNGLLESLPSEMGVILEEHYLYKEKNFPKQQFRPFWRRMLARIISPGIHLKVKLPLTPKIPA